MRLGKPPGAGVGGEFAEGDQADLKRHRRIRHQLRLLVQDRPDL
ncbi:hypothetical protein ACTMS0_26905 [Micromonospora sp. H33]